VDGIVRISEMEVHAIPEHLHDLAAMICSYLANELGERERHLGRNLIPCLLGQGRVAGEVREGCGLDAWCYDDSLAHLGQHRHVLGKPAARYSLGLIAAVRHRNSEHCHP
jgi:hypothetical protein